MLLVQDPRSVSKSLRARRENPGRGLARRCRPGLESLEARVVLSGGNETWYLSTSPSNPFSFGGAGWVPVGLGNGTYAVVDTSGQNPVSPGNDVWYLSSNPNQPFGFGAAGWTPVGMGNGNYAVVDTSGDNAVSPGNDVWYLNTSPGSPFGFGAAGWVPVGFGNGAYGAVDTSGYNPVAPGQDVWYFSTSPNSPFGYGRAGAVPVGFSNGAFAAVETSGNNPVSLGNDVWYLSTNAQPFGYGAAGWVPVSIGATSFAAVDTSVGSPVAPVAKPDNIWAGYVVSTLPGTVSNVRASWYVPTVTGANNTYSATWVGIDGYQTPTVEQAGTFQFIENGVAQYYAWFEMYPAPPIFLTSPSAKVNPGDLITASVTYVGGGKFTFDISNQGQNGSQGWIFRTTQTLPAGYTAQRSTAEWIEEAPAINGSPSALANFGSVTFSNMLATIGGGTQPINIGNINDQGNKNYLINMSGPSGTATTSQLSSTNNGFRINFGSSTPAAPTSGPLISYFGPSRGSSSKADRPKASNRFFTVPGVTSIPAAEGPSAPNPSIKGAGASRPGKHQWAVGVARQVSTQGSRRIRHSFVVDRLDGPGF